MINVALVANSGPALEAMTSNLASLTNVCIVRHCNGGMSIGRSLKSCAPDLVLIDEMSWPRLALQRVAEVRVAVPRAKVVVRTSGPDADWLADALRAGASAVVPQSAGPATLGIVLNEVIDEPIWAIHEPLAGAS
jgi:DNA-binding NarL/FixJ family response regulator